MRKDYAYAVTFEAPSSRAPMTIRGTVTAGNPAYAASLAVRQAKDTVPGIRYDSLVVLLEPVKPAPPA